MIIGVLFIRSIIMSPLLNNAFDVHCGLELTRLKARARHAAFPSPSYRWQTPAHAHRFRFNLILIKFNFRFRTLTFKPVSCFKHLGMLRQT